MIAVGCDWAREAHQFVVLSSSKEELACFSVPHSAQGLAEIARRLEALEPDASQVRVAIEGHDGPLMDWLEDQGYVVFSVNPKASNAARNLVSSGGSKDDKLDAQALAQVVLLDAPRIVQRAKPQHNRRSLALLLRQRERRVEERGDLLRRLGQILQEWAPTVAALCTDLGLVWTRQFVGRWPLEQDVVAADPRTLRAFVAKHPLRGSTRQRILDARRARPMPIRPERLALLRHEIQFLLAQLETVLAEIQSLEEALTCLVESDPAHPVLSTLPGTSIVTEAAWLAALAHTPPDCSDWRSVASHVGVSPVTRASGSARGVHLRRSRDPMLQRLLTYHAFQTSRIGGCWAHRMYHAKRARGQKHYTTLRGIAQRWVKIVHAMTRNHTPYQERASQDPQEQRLRNAA